jgi:hypothetical protein
LRYALLMRQTGGQDIRRTRFDLSLDLVIKSSLAEATETLRSAKWQTAALDEV